MALTAPPPDLPKEDLDTGAASPAAPVPALPKEEERKRKLTSARRRATGLLGVATLIFIVTTVFRGDSTWMGYVQATAEAGMIGGLADWFAVTALFRRPLGLPIPHTAVIVEKRDQFAATLGDFIQESLLTPEVIVDRVRTANVVPRIAAWLSDADNAQRISAEVADAAVGLADLLRDEDVHDLFENLVRERVDAVELAPMAGRALRFVTADGRHEEALDAAFRGLDRYLDEHQDELRARLGDQSPWWLPRAAEDQIFERLLRGARDVLHEMATDREHELRKQFENRLDELAAELETSPELLARGEELKHDLLSQPQIRNLATTLWSDAKAQLRAQASDPESELRQRLAAALRTTGERLRDDPALAARAEESIESAVGYVARRFDGEIADVVTQTIERWDTEETARRLELLLGPDLQYIRINGTVVGALAGLVLHAITQIAR